MKCARHGVSKVQIGFELRVAVTWATEACYIGTAYTRACVVSRHARAPCRYSLPSGKLGSQDKEHQATNSEVLPEQRL